MDTQPGFFTYLMEGTQRGLERGERAKAAAAQKAEQDRQFGMQQDQLAMQREQQALQQRQIMAMLSPLEMRNDLMQNPTTGGMPGMIAPPTQTVPGASGGKDISLFMPPTRAPVAPTKRLDLVSDDARGVMGFRTRAQEAGDTEAIDLARIRGSRRSGATISDAEAEAIGAVSPEAKQLKRITELESPLRSLAARHVANVMTTTKGRVNPAQLAQLATQGFDAFRQDRLMKGMNLTPDEEPYARSFFGQAVMDAFKEQEEGDLKAQIARDNAAAQKARTGGNPAAMANAVGKLASSMQTRIAQMDKGPEAMIYKLAPDAFNADAEMVKMFGSKYNEYQMVNRSLQFLQQTHAQYIAGLISPEDLAQTIADVAGLGMDVGTPPPTPAPGGRQTGAGQKPGSKRVITKDEADYLKAKGQWDPSKYEIKG